MTVDVVAAVRADFGLTLRAPAPVRSGADESARPWEATDDKGDRYAVKLSRGGRPADRSRRQRVPRRQRRPRA